MTIYINDKICAPQNANVFSRMGDAIRGFFRNLFAVREENPLGLDNAMTARLYL